MLPENAGPPGVGAAVGPSTTTNSIVGAFDGSSEEVGAIDGTFENDGNNVEPNIVGDDEGVPVGLSDGSSERADGDTLGLAEDKVGPTVGEDVGIFVVGIKDGMDVGEDVGGVDGDVVGRVVGGLVGFSIPGSTVPVEGKVGLGLGVSTMPPA